jgi:hypothetical protein
VGGLGATFTHAIPAPATARRDYPPDAGLSRTSICSGSVTTISGSLPAGQ